MNCAIIDKTTREIKFFILNAVHNGKGLVETLNDPDGPCVQVKLELFDLLWTSDDIRNSAVLEDYPTQDGDEKPVKFYDRDIKSLSRVPEFKGVPVDTKEGVNEVVRGEIRQMYSRSQEFKTLRMAFKQLAEVLGETLPQEFDEYDQTIENIVAESNTFTANHVPDRVQSNGKPKQ